MTDGPDLPQINLVTPLEFDFATFPDVLKKMIEIHPIACVRLALATKDQDLVIRSADAIHGVLQEYDIALIVQDHTSLVARLGLDGVHLNSGSQSVRDVRKELGADAIVGAYCADSRHDGMTAGEAGADYVSFGPVIPSELETQTAVEADLFQWWSEMIEIPVIAEGGLTIGAVKRVAPFADFLSFGEELWSSDDPVAQYKIMIDAMMSAVATS